MRKLFCFAYIIFSSIRAQTLPEITATASQLPLSTQELPTTLTTFDSNFLQNLQPSNLGDLLSKSGVAFIREYGGSGLSNIALRGSSASQTALLIDGIPLNDPQIGFLDLKLIPPTLFKQVEVQHGSSAVHGSDAIGGAVSLRTLSPFADSEQLKMRLQTHFGAFQLRKFESEADFNAPNFQFRIFGGYKKTKGNFPYLDLSLIPASVHLRENSDFANAYLFNGIAWKNKNRTHRISTWFTAADRGLATPIGSAASGERQAEKNGRMWYEAEFPRNNQRQLNFKLMLYGSEIRYTHPQLNINDLGAHWVAWMQLGLHKIRFRNSLQSFSLQAQNAVARHPSLPQKTHRQQFSLSNNSVIHHKNNTLFSTLRWDIYRLENRVVSSFNPSLGWNFKSSEKHFWKAHLSRSFRMPTLNDLYWRPGGNPDLQPESAWSVSVGTGYRPPKSLLESGLFIRKTDHEIVWMQGNSFWSPLNVKKTLAFGVEMQAQSQKNWTSTLKWNTQLSATLLKAVDISNSSDTQTYFRQLRYVPQSQLGSMNQLQFRRSHLNWNLQFIGKRYTTTDESQFLKPILASDARIRHDWITKNWTLQVGMAVENIFGKNYQLYQGYPMPPRHLNFNLNLLYK